LAEPPILRVSLTRVNVDLSVNKSDKTKPSPVIFKGQVLVASENRPKPLYDDPKKIASFLEPITTTVYSTVVSEVVHEQPQVLSEQTPVLKLSPVSPAATTHQQNLARLCSNIAESTARMVLAESNPISASTIALATLTAFNSSQLCQTTSQGVSKLCEQSGVVCDSSIMQKAAALSEQAKKDCNDAVATTTASSAAYSRDILATCAPISQHTINLQNESLKGMNEIMNQDIAEVVRKAMSVRI